MLTFPTSRGPEETQVPSLALPPFGFYIPHEIKTAGRSAAPFKRPSGGAASSPAQKAGLRFQRRIEHALRTIYSAEIGPWFRYTDAGIIPRWCQPDALILSPRPIVIEIKTRWMDTAWWQLSQLYVPVLRKAFGCEFSPVAIVRSFDPSVMVPEQPVLLPNLNELLPDGKLGVVLWP